MPEYLVVDTDLTAIASAIRTKGGTSAGLAFPSEFISAINAISGGGEDGDNLSYGDKTKPLAGIGQAGYTII